MHDQSGKPLAKGDQVTLLATIIDLSPTDEFCNVSLESVYGRRPDGTREKVYALNTGVLDKVDPAPDPG